MKMVGHILSSLLLMGCLFLSTITYAQYDPSHVSGPNHQPEIIESQQDEPSSRGVMENQGSENAFDKRESDRSKGLRSDLNTAKDNVTPQLEVQKSKSTSRKVSKEQKQEKVSNDDSVLSFNFLYYMIQKFKFSDLEE